MYNAKQMRVWKKYGSLCKMQKLTWHVKYIAVPNARDFNAIIWYESMHFVIMRHPFYSIVFTLQSLDVFFKIRSITLTWKFLLIQYRKKDSSWVNVWSIFFTSTHHRALICYNRSPFAGTAVQTVAQFCSVSHNALLRTKTQPWKTMQGHRPSLTCRKSSCSDLQDPMTNSVAKINRFTDR